MTGFILLILAAFGCVAGVALAVIVRADRQRRWHLTRLRRGAQRLPSGPVLTARKTPQKRSHAEGLTTWVERHLAQTALRVTVAEILVQVALAVLGVYGIAVLFAGVHPLLAMPVSVALPVLAAAALVRRAKQRYRAAFTDGLPEALDVFARGLRAGRPIADSLAIVVETSKGPVQSEFTRCHAEIRMGTALPDSLSRLERRMPTPEVSFFAVATALQAETGGNLIETMESLGNQLRERRKLRKKARALTSEARASAMILAALPFAVTLAIALLNAGYLEPLYADPRGRVMAVVALGSVGLGVYLMARMGKLDV